VLLQDGGKSVAAWVGLGLAASLCIFCSGWTENCLYPADDIGLLQHMAGSLQRLQRVGVDIRLVENRIRLTIVMKATDVDRLLQRLPGPAL